MYEVGLGDSPMRIARRLTGDPRRYVELLAANPHKPVVFVGGWPTFASLGVGEQLCVPHTFGVHGDPGCPDCCGGILSDWGLGSPYGDALAKVGLNPDNPDEMYRQLLLYIAAPKAFKDRDPNWPGARDNLAWWEEPKGTAKLNWPFHGGKWLDVGWNTKTDAQWRAVFKVPKGISTKAWLSKMWGFPMHLHYSLQSVKVDSGFDLIKTAGSVIDQVGKWITSIPGVKDAMKLYVDLDFAALGALINIFIPSPGSDILHGVANVAQDQAKRSIDGLGPKQPKEIVEIILHSLNFLGDAKPIVEYVVYSLLSANTIDAQYLAQLFTFTPPPGADPMLKQLATVASALWSGPTIDPAIRQIVPPLARMIGSIATTGKVYRSDLLSLLGVDEHNEAVNKVLDLFGVRDSAPPTPRAPAHPPSVPAHKQPPAPAPHQKPAPAPATPPHKVIKLRLGPPAPAPVTHVRRPGRPYEPYRHGAQPAQKRV